MMDKKNKYAIFAAIIGAVGAIIVAGMQISSAKSLDRDLQEARATSEVLQEQLRDAKSTIEALEITPVPPTPKVIGLDFAAPVCSTKKEIIDLAGNRIVLREDLFAKLNLPVGTLVTLNVEINGQALSVNNLILDSDKTITECFLLLDFSTRDALNPLLHDETKKEFSKRDIYNWHIEYQE